MIALTLAVVHHAASNFAVNAVPPSWGTVLETADKFSDYINTGTIQSRRRSK